MKILTVYTDGSYFSNLKAEGLSFRILGLKEGPVNFSAGRIVTKKKGGSSAIAEVYAVIQALKKIKRMSINCEQIVLNIDFDSIVNVINNFYMYPYENSSYYKKGGCWKELIDLLSSSKYKIVANWVKGHTNSNMNNNIVDLLARNAAMSAYEDQHKYFQIYSTDERLVEDFDMEMQKSYKRASELKIQQLEESQRHEQEKYLSRKRALKAVDRRKNKNKNRYVLSKGKKEIIIKESMDLKDAIHFKAEILDSLYEKISLKMTPSMMERFLFFAKSIENYVENMSFIYEEDKDIYVHIANALKCVRNRHQNLEFLSTE